MKNELYFCYTDFYHFSMFNFEVKNEMGKNVIFLFQF